MIPRLKEEYLVTTFTSSKWRLCETFRSWRHPPRQRRARDPHKKSPGWIGANVVEDFWKRNLKGIIERSLERQSNTQLPRSQPLASRLGYEARSATCSISRPTQWVTGTSGDSASAIDNRCHCHYGERTRCRSTRDHFQSFVTDLHVCLVVRVCQWLKSLAFLAHELDKWSSWPLDHRG